MDRSTLSHYGWVVIVIIIIVILIGFTGRYDVFWTEFEKGIEGALKPPTVDLVPLTEADYYYDSVAAAVANLNDHVLNGAELVGNAEIDASQAVAGIIKDTTPMTVVVLKNSAEANRIEPSVDMTINLNGKTISSDSHAAIDIYGGKINIDGHIRKSAIVTSGSGSVCVQARAGELNVNGGTYIINSDLAARSIHGAVFNTGVKTTIKNATIKADLKTSESKKAHGIAVQTSDPVTLEKSTIDVKGNTNAFGILAKQGQLDVKGSKINVQGTLKCFGIDSTGNSNVNNCKINVQGETSGYGICVRKNSNIENSEIIACSSYAGTSSGYTKTASGIHVNLSGNATIKNCHVKGIHSGISASGLITIDGGTYEGYGHGGVYFSKSNSEYRIKNATFKQCPWFGPGTDEGASCNRSAMYIGGSSDTSGIKVYVDNCIFESARWSACLRDANGEHDNALYLSNSKFGTGNQIRLGGPTNRVYIGEGNAFSTEAVYYYTNGASASQVTVTTDTYA